jgi:hypothetical protein
MAKLLRLSLAVAALLTTTLGLNAQERMLFDFERGALGDAWSASGKLQAARIKSPAPVESRTSTAPRGNVIQIDTTGGAGLFVRSGQAKAEWENVETVSFWVFRAAAEARSRPQSTIEFQFYEPDGKSRFWRKVDVAHSGWQRYELPLKWFRWGEGRIPAWQNVDRFGFYFRDGAALAIDNLTIDIGEDGSRLQAGDLQQLAFAADAKVKVTDTDRLLLLTDVPSLDAAALMAHFQKVSDDVLQSFSLAPPAVPIPLVVFQHEADYREFPQKLGQKQNAAAARPTSGGYALCGIATSFWDERHGTLRPVFTHEFVHALLSHAARLDNRGDWLQEGAATLFQMKYHRQENLNQLIAQGISDRSAHSPLEELASGERIAMNRYWQAMTLVETLSTDKMFSQQFPSFMEAVGQTGNTDLRLHLKPIFRTEWPTLTERWRKHCEQNYPVP